MTTVSLRHRSGAPLTALLFACALSIGTAYADSMRSRCGYNDSAASEPEAYQACVFSQRQGYISISVGGQCR